jgi:hypothetical protein
MQDSSCLIPAGGKTDLKDLVLEGYRGQNLQPDGRPQAGPGMIRHLRKGKKTWQREGRTDGR